MNKSQTAFSRRFVYFAIVLALSLGAIDYFIGRLSHAEKRSQLVVQVNESNKILSGELYRLFYGLEDDFNYFELQLKEILRSRDKTRVKYLIDFLNTHPHYFKVRLTLADGQEIFKIVQRPDRISYEESKNLFDLSSQVFFQELNRVSEKDFYLSSMEANVINGVMETPLRPTVRVSKRVQLEDGKEGLLILNIDGQKILQLFDRGTFLSENPKSMALIDHDGTFVASFPILTLEDYTVRKRRLDLETFKKIQEQKNIQGSVEAGKTLQVFTKFPLPRSKERWFLVTSIPEEIITMSLQRSRLTRLFWELLAFILISIWFWRDEKKRHREQVVEVLLRERSEFIQNVSHQLKTPLTIMLNDLNTNIEEKELRLELRKEVTHLIKVIEDLLLLSQIESLEKIPLKRESILEIINEAIDLIGQKAREKSVNIRLNIQDKLIEMVDLLEQDFLPELMKSAFLNLLDNAVDFTPPNRTITISVSKTGEKLVVLIQDQGPGVSQDVIPYLFQRHIRSSSNGRKGSGLGLAIVKKIVELHRGEIRYLPHPEGACFEIRL
jgi:signal transduction histidine kinase